MKMSASPVPLSAFLCWRYWWWISSPLFGSNGLAEAQHVDTHCAVLGLANRCREWLEVGGLARDVEPFGGIGDQRSMAPASTRMMLPV
jgi:hypothetical protein